MLSSLVRPCVEYGILFWAWNCKVERKTQGSRPHKEAQQNSLLQPSHGEATGPAVGGLGWQRMLLAVPAMASCSCLGTCLAIFLPPNMQSTHH